VRLGAFAIEMGKVVSVRPFGGTSATLHVISMEPLTKLGRSAIAAATLRSEEFFMCVVFVPQPVMKLSFKPHDLLYILDR